MFSREEENKRIKRYRCRCYAINSFAMSKNADADADAGADAGAFVRTSKRENKHAFSRDECVWVWFGGIVFCLVFLLALPLYPWVSLPSSLPVAMTRRHRWAHRCAMKLVRKRLLDELDAALGNPRPCRLTTRIAHLAARTARNRHRADSIPHLLFNHRLPVRSSREHAHALASTVLDTSFGPRDEELDAEYPLAVWHPQDLVHPWAHPLEGLAVGDGPDEEETLGGGCAVVKAGD